MIRNFSERLPGAVVDNEDERFSLVGEWTRASAQQNKWGTSYHYKFAHTGYGEAIWNIYTPNPGLYEISIWYPEAFNRATDAPFTIYHADGESTFIIDQQQTGGQWVVLGEFRFEDDAESRVVLATDVSDSTKLVVADAVRARLLDKSDIWMIR